MELPLKPVTLLRVLEALDIEDSEGAIETVFEDHPTATRDDVVDTVNAIEKQMEEARGQ